MIRARILPFATTLSVRRWVKGVALAAACLLAIVVVSGASFEAVMRRRAARDYPPPGRLVDVVPRAYLPSSIDALRREADAISATLDAAGQVHRLGDRPLVVLTATAKTSPAMLAAEGITQAQADRMQAAWETLQADAATWSTGGRHERVPHASHYIQFDRPDVVIGAVRDVVARVRQRPRSERAY